MRAEKLWGSCGQPQVARRILGRRSMHLKRSIKHPIREFVDMDHRWRGPDAGLIWCWELGKQRADKEPELAERVREGALVPLGWKGGVANGTKSKKKKGSLFYLAEWQGLAGKDLDIDAEGDTRLVCLATGVEVTYSLPWCTTPLRAESLP